MKASPTSNRVCEHSTLVHFSGDTWRCASSKCRRLFAFPHSDQRPSTSGTAPTVSDGGPAEAGHLPVETSDHSELLKKTPHVNTEFVAEVQQLSRQELERRVLIQKDWLGHYSRCLDGLGIKNIGVESCWNPRDIRRAFESLSKSPLEPAGDDFAFDRAVAAEEARQVKAKEPVEQLPTETGLRPGELAQLRRIDAATRFYVDSVKPGRGVAWENLINALFDGRPEETMALSCIWRSGCKHPDMCKSAGCCVPGEPDALRTDDDPLSVLTHHPDAPAWVTEYNLVRDGSAKALYKCDQCGTPMRCGPQEWERQCNCGSEKQKKLSPRRLPPREFDIESHAGLYTPEKAICECGNPNCACPRPKELL
jgi:hypothetical protein